MSGDTRVVEGVFQPGSPVPGWGYVGRNTFQQLDARGGCYGVVRQVDEGYKYCATDIPLPTLVWRQSNGGRDSPTFEMELDAGASLEFHSLDGLARRLRERLAEAAVRGNALPRDDPQLAELNWVVDQVLHTACLLHASEETLDKCGVQPLDPKNVLYYRRDNGGLQLVLPDVFFRWPAGRPPPRTLATAEQDEFAGMWGGRRRSEIYSQPFDAGAELRALARMLAWVMIGQTPKSLPSPRDDSSKAAHIWSALWRCIPDASSAPAPSLGPTGVEPQSLPEALPVEPLTTVEDLRQEVLRYPLAEHFTLAGSRKNGWAGWLKSHWAAGLVRLGGVVLLVAGVFAIARAIVGAGPREPPSEVNRLLKEKMPPLVERFREMEPRSGSLPDDLPLPCVKEQLGNLADQVRLLDEVNQARSDQDWIRAKEEKWIEAEQTRWMGSLEKECGWLIQVLRYMPNGREQQDLARRPMELSSQFRRVFPNREVPAWLRDYERRVRFY
jgi:hypothetical protein